MSKLRSMWRATSGPRRLMILIGVKFAFIALVTGLTLYFMLGR